MGTCGHKREPRNALCSPCLSGTPAPETGVVFTAVPAEGKKHADKNTSAHEAMCLTMLLTM